MLMLVEHLQMLINHDFVKFTALLLMRIPSITQSFVKLAYFKGLRLFIQAILQRID